jgi:hypothetical protein
MLIPDMMHLVDDAQHKFKLSQNTNNTIVKLLFHYLAVEVQSAAILFGLFGFHKFSTPLSFRVMSQACAYQFNLNIVILDPSHADNKFC